MNVALSRTGAWVLRSFFVLVVIFLYARRDPGDLLVQRLAAARVPAERVHVHWYHEFLVNADLRSRSRRCRCRDLEHR